MLFEDQDCCSMLPAWEDIVVTSSEFHCSPPQPWNQLLSLEPMTLLATTELSFIKLEQQTDQKSSLSSKTLLKDKLPRIPLPLVNKNQQQSIFKIVDSYDDNEELNCQSFTIFTRSAPAQDKCGSDTKELHRLRQNMIASRKSRLRKHKRVYDLYQQAVALHQSNAQLEEQTCFLEQSHKELLLEVQSLQKQLLSYLTPLSEDLQVY